MSDAEATPSGKEIGRSDYAIAWIAVHLKRNAARPLDMVELMGAAIETIQQEYDAKSTLRGDGHQPFIIEDVVIDVVQGIVTFYVNWNEELP